MIKIIISVYIATILLFAGFAEAKINTLSNFQRLSHSSKVWLNVGDAKYDSRHEILTLAGKVSAECLHTLAPEMNFDERTQQVLVSVTAEGANCFDATDLYEIVIDLKAFFSENVLAQNTMVKFNIDNFTGGGEYSFNYLAKQQVQYSFDTRLEGRVEMDHSTGKFYLIGRGSKIEILSRFDLFNYENKFVQLKGLIPNNFSIGDMTNPANSQLIVGQLTALR